MPKFDIIHRATKKIVFSLFGLLCCLCFVMSGTILMFIDRIWLVERMSEGVRAWLITFSLFGVISPVSLLMVWIFIEITEPHPQSPPE